MALIFFIKEKIILKRFLSFALVFCLIIPCVFFLSGCGGDEYGLSMDNPVIMTYTDDVWRLEDRNSIDGYKGQTYYFKFTTEMNCAPSKVIVFESVQEDPVTLTNTPLTTKDCTISIHTGDKVKQLWHLDNFEIKNADGTTRYLEYGSTYYISVKLYIDAFLGVRLEK